MVSIAHIKHLRQYALKNGFSFPKGFLERSPHWLRSQYNGIGAEWMPKYLRRILTKSLRHMQAESLVHDIEFLCKNKSFWNFTKANFRLLYNSFRARHFVSGIIMFFACQLFGWSAWKEGKEAMVYYYYFKESK